MGGGVKATGWGESPSALGAGQALMSQLFSEWALWGPAEGKREI